MLKEEQLYNSDQKVRTSNLKPTWSIISHQPCFYEFSRILSSLFYVKLTNAYRDWLF